MPPPLEPKPPRLSKQMDVAIVGKLPQFPKCDPTPAYARTLYPGRPLEDNGTLAGLAHLHTKHVPYSLQSHTVSDENLAISVESPDTQGRHWFDKKEERLYTISHSINENLLLEKADAYPTSREEDDSYGALELSSPGPTSRHPQPSILGRVPIQTRALQPVRLPKEQGAPSWLRSAGQVSRSRGALCLSRESTRR